MDMPGPCQQKPWDISRGQRGHRAERGEDRPVRARRQRHRHAGWHVVADDDRAHVDPGTGQLVQHEPPGGVGAHRGHEANAKPEPGGGHRRDRGRSPDGQADAVHQLLLLAERGGDVAAEHEHVRVAVAQHHEVMR
ncbi:MAG TPA: hypothetical protein VF070_31070 [Streptosporangiaceae bacterium]